MLAFIQDIFLKLKSILTKIDISCVQYLHTKTTAFDGFTFVYDIRISVDTWNSPKVVSKKV